MASFPNYSEFIDSLSRKAGGLGVDPDVGLFQQQHLDSVDVIEWLYALEDSEIVKFDDSIAELIGTKTVKELYQILSDLRNP